ncbi:hypothetical protein Dda_9277 [Drechslerella dactyloides]|uniref:Uncharacterized protein n=1 Tax=Drechslerella dactyloides TaxID=74499 RepID=A0AAD6NF91_DREDA|nr:hypothetical protein Dda_9277 [Drechslerella dactyloides]
MQLQFSTIAVIAAMATNVSAGWFAFYNDPSYQLVVKDGNAKCSNDCMRFTNVARAAKVYGSGGKFTSCSVYQSGDCSGNYVTIYSDKNKNERAYQLTEGAWSAKCYFGC